MEKTGNNQPEDLQEKMQTNNSEKTAEKMEKKPDYQRLLVISMVVLLIFSLGLGVYLYTENQKLEAKILDLEGQVIAQKELLNEEDEYFFEANVLDTSGWEEVEFSSMLDVQNPDLKALLPPDAEVVEGTIYSNNDIYYQGEKLLSFSIPISFEIPNEVASYTNVLLSNEGDIYRVNEFDESSEINAFYTSYIQFTDVCYIMGGSSRGEDAKLEPPCTGGFYSLGEGELATTYSISFYGDETNVVIADEIVKSLRGVE